MNLPALSPVWHPSSNILPPPHGTDADESGNETDRICSAMLMPFFAFHTVGTSACPIGGHRYEIAKQFPGHVQYRRERRIDSHAGSRGRSSVHGPVAAQCAIAVHDGAAVKD